MTPEAQQIAIEEACGWSRQTLGNETYWWHEENNKYLPTSDDGFRNCPDYLNDLNAMHEAEHALQGEPGCDSPEYSEYCRQIYAICKRDKKVGGNGEPYSATAAQRAEAFLKTLNLWTT